MSSLRSLLEADRFKRIPLKKLSTGHYTFAASLNGVPAAFILDTGASSSCVDSARASHFNMIKEESDIKAAGAGALDMETFVAHGNQLLIKGLHPKTISIVLFNMEHVNQALMQVNELAVDGIIGADFLKKWRAVIDYGRNALYLK